MPSVYDLTALMKVLEENGANSKLALAIRRANDVSSAHRDIEEAALALRLLIRLTSASDETPLDDHDITTVVGSLLTSAIVTYARATDTTPIGRRPWFGVGKLPNEMRAIHRTIMHLRNKEVAHFGKGEIIDGAPLLSEALVLRPESTTHPIGYRTRRAHNRAELVKRFEQLVSTVLALAIKAVNSRFTELHAILRGLAERRDPILAQLRGLPLLDPGLLAMEESTRWVDASSAEARVFNEVAVVEIYDDPSNDNS